MSARSRAQPWFARTHDELGAEFQRRRWERMELDREEEFYDQWMSGGNPAVDMATAERFIARKALWLSQFMPPWDLGSDGLVSVRHLIRRELLGP